LLNPYRAVVRIDESGGKLDAERILDQDGHSRQVIFGPRREGARNLVVVAEACARKALLEKVARRVGGERGVVVLVDSDLIGVAL